ncbi:uncharacterized protein LOC111056169 isoform X2 [Nilaparvata lugens]|uniref:uncharacterized protein LOC111056169 isoform X1 n=1 Tax=Nilaparvata lugens TaxID=108931 RepID=UPI00193CEF3D|nr:uncharacterized protein LOC111056169 isoform X1 [Nilaparvata lugens]XP_039279970.1 uncharacterized protein LOC111056169 isoform X2 [Nilaparvata lugens]
MHGARRVICFCFLTAVLPTILVILPLYLRHSVYADVTYAVAESDVMEIVNGISSIFCQAHSLKMNSSFSAFQVSGEPEISTTNRKHIRLKKSMSLPDDTLEYWGFFLPRGSTVHLSVCSRYDGSRILVVEGEKNLRTCGLDEPNRQGLPTTHMAQGADKVRVLFETVQEILPANEEVDDKDHLDDDYYEGESDADVGDNEGEVVRNDDHAMKEEQPMSPTLVKEKEPISATLTPPFAGKEEFGEGIKLQRHLRHSRMHRRNEKQLLELERLDGDESNLNRIKRLQRKLSGEDGGVKGVLTRRRRRANGVPTHKLDGGMVHGGNARNHTEKDNDSSVSSFENSLLTCYDRHILLTKGFPPSHLCTSVKYLESSHYSMQTTHEVDADGYYYYIFYSDNDHVMNDIHAIFDIHKPTFQFGNYSKGCINTTECTFPIALFSDETVVVEVPTRDGIEHEADDITFLHSTCHPRTAVYAVFPITVLFLILGCSFL